MTTIVKFRFTDAGPEAQINWGKGEGWWQGYCFIALYIEAVCRQLDAKNIGFPTAIVEGPFVEMTNEDCKNAEEKWHCILRNIADGFHLIATKDNYDMTEEEKKLVEDAKLNLATWFEHLWD